MNKKRIWILFTVPVFAAVFILPAARTQNNKTMTKKQNSGHNHQSSGDHRQTATLGGGCFWCLEAIYERLRGIEQVVSGYSGGNVAHPTYDAVCTGSTGHAEVCQITFDPGVISYRELLEVFFDIHDPTSLNRQGADIGTQYRSVIFYHTPDQERTARELIMAMEQEKRYNKPIVTQVEPFRAFYKAEDYHQNYFVSNPAQPYCSVIISPKVKKFEKNYKEKLK